MIPAVLLTGVDTARAGPVVATVSQNVYDTVSGRHLVLPQPASVPEHQPDHRTDHPDGGVPDGPGGGAHRTEAARLGARLF
ncbi:TrbI/VirB10 family protein [Halomonas sp. ND22Bw]|uniref:TrbI/VirB10 family protein n=1 Tax=Halomonas sp. ND22Bw TaxID=2054178 RepID=UPI0034E07B3F